MKKIIFLLVIFFSLVSCNNNISSNNEKDLIKLAGKKFVLDNKEYMNMDVNIEFSDDEIFGFTGINKYFAGYSIKDNKIYLEAGASTLMAGDLNKMKSEAEIIEVISNSEDISFNEGKLVLKSKNKELIFTEVFNTIAEKYIYEKYPDISITFKGNNVFGKNTVNNFFGQYLLNGNKISFSKISSTRMAGSEEEMKKEFEFFNDLKNVVEFKKENNKLILITKDNKKLVLIKN